MIAKVINKTRINLEEIIWHRDIRATLRIILSVLNRRRIPIPSSIVTAFNQVDTESTDMGDENFLTNYMIPTQGKSFIDIGAATGGWSLFVAQKGHHVYAFEPSPKAYAILVSRLKKYSNAHTYPYALGDKDTQGRLGLAALSLSGTMDAEVGTLQGGGTIDIVVRKLDSLNLSRVGVIKIDTEGYETPILRGAEIIIRSNKPRLVIEVHKASGKAAPTFDEELVRVEHILRGLGYRWTVRCRRISLRDVQPFVIAEPDVAI